MKRLTDTVESFLPAAIISKKKGRIRKYSTTWSKSYLLKKLIQDFIVSLSINPTDSALLFAFCIWHPFCCIECANVRLSNFVEWFSIWLLPDCYHSWRTSSRNRMAQVLSCIIFDFMYCWAVFVLLVRKCSVTIVLKTTLNQFTWASFIKRVTRFSFSLGDFFSLAAILSTRFFAGWTYLLQTSNFQLAMLTQAERRKISPDVSGLNLRVNPLKFCM